MTLWIVLKKIKTQQVWKVPLQPGSIGVCHSVVISEV